MLGNPMSSESQTDRINEIRDFLTLTSQNTSIFYEDMKNHSEESAKKSHKVITDFKVKRALGKGAFGEVFMVQDN